MKTIANIFKALSDNNRVRIMSALLKARGELCICEIMDSLELAQYNVSKYVRELRLAGLIEERREGRFIFYTTVKPNSTWMAFLYKSLGTLENKILSDDFRRMKKRLKLRKRGKCVVGISSKRSAL